MIIELKLLIMGASLAIGSYQDLKTREIDDRLWIIVGIAGGLLTIAEVVTSPSYPILVALFSIVITAALAFGVYFLGLYGGADAKALLMIAITMPVNTFQASLISPLFPISVFGNALVISLLVIPACLIFNIYRATKEPLFSGVKAGPFRKLVVLFTGVKVSPETAKSVHFNLVERPLPSGGSELRLVHRVEEDEPKIFVEGAKSVWVTPALPMIVFFLAGFILALLGVDIIIGALSLFL
jgi:preflagellin peptidase FlaK